VSGAAAIASRLAALRARVADAAHRAGRDPAGVEIVGASKRQPAQAAVHAVRAGLRALAENYVQEARDKIPAVAAALAAEGLPAPRWHLIGRLQRNKVREALRLFDVVETLDGIALGDELERRAAELARRVPVLIQVNLCGEAQKGGVAPAEAARLVAASAAWTHLELIGLMAIPAAASRPEASRGAFARLRGLRDELRAQPAAPRLRELSMGMSGDFEIAVEEGASWLRIGSALFGPRAPAGRGRPPGARPAEGERG